MARHSTKSINLQPNRNIIRDGLAKINISAAKGKKLFDKRREIAKKDIQREMDRQYKQR